MRMTERAKGESLSVAPDSLLQILQLSKLLEASRNSVGEVVERCGAMRMTGRAKGKSLPVVLDGLLQIPHLS
jgi:hypothetical protein